MPFVTLMTMTSAQLCKELAKCERSEALRQSHYYEAIASELRTRREIWRKIAAQAWDRSERTEDQR